MHHWKHQHSIQKHTSRVTKHIWQINYGWTSKHTYAVLIHIVPELCFVLYSNLLIQIGWNQPHQPTEVPEIWFLSILDPYMGYVHINFHWALQFWHSTDSNNHCLYLELTHYWNQVNASWRWGWQWWEPEITEQGQQSNNCICMSTVNTQKIMYPTGM